MKYVNSDTPVKPVKLKSGVSGVLRGRVAGHIQKHSLFFKQVTNRLERPYRGFLGFYGGTWGDIFKNTNRLEGVL